MKFKKSIFILAGLILSGTACKKDDPETTTDQPEEKNMTISIQGPQTGTIFNFNDVISIHGDIHSNFDAHGYIIRYWNATNDDSLLYEVDGHEHGEAIQFSASWTNNLTDTSDVRIEVIASSDHQGTYTETRDVTVICHPL